MHLMNFSVEKLEFRHGPKGSVVKVLRKSDASFEDFGELYFSFVDLGQIKGWKRHRTYSLNLVVVSGAVTFAIYDRRLELVRLDSGSNYLRLWIKAGTWFAFRGEEENNQILSVIPGEHDPQEVETIEHPAGDKFIHSILSMT